MFYFWNYLYKLIKLVNDVLKIIIDDFKKEDCGQVLGMCVFVYLILVQMYQYIYVGYENVFVVFIVLEIIELDVLSNNFCVSVKEVYDLIEKDLVQVYSDLFLY